MYIIITEAPAGHQGARPGSTRDLGGRSDKYVIARSELRHKIPRGNEAISKRLIHTLESAAL